MAGPGAGVHAVTALVVADTDRGALGLTVGCSSAERLIAEDTASVIRTKGGIRFIPVDKRYSILRANCTLGS